jgi:hypothetical protein
VTKREGRYQVTAFIVPGNSGKSAASKATAFHLLTVIDPMQRDNLGGFLTSYCAQPKAS